MATTTLSDKKINELCDLTQHLKVEESENAGIPLKNGYRLFSYQEDVLTWMKYRENRKNEHGIQGGIISLYMGLGKTLIALAHSLQNKSSFPTLVITSKTVMYEWKSEGVEKFYDENAIKVLYLHRDFIGKKIESVNRDQVMTYDIVITTYDVCMSSCRKGEYYLQCLKMGDEGTLTENKVVAINTRTRRDASLPRLKGADIIYGTPWNRVICDESQRYANPKTLTYKCMMAVYGRYKWCLTGTPIRNYDTDIWAQLRFCGYTGVDRASHWKNGGVQFFRQHNLKSSIFTMSYSDANISMPEKIEQEINVQLVGQHKEIYENMLQETREMYKKMMADLCSFTSMITIFTRLRQCVIAPYLITPDAKRGCRKSGNFQNCDEWHLNKSGEAGLKSSKIAKIIDIINSVTTTTCGNSKVIVFSMFTSCLDLLGDAISEKYPEFQFVQVDGDVKKNRNDLFKQFKTDPKIQGLFMTYKVGSEGLNLTEATHCIFIEPWWTNAVHNQAKARLWRTGQTKPVFVYNVIVKGTIEEQILEICRQKDDMSSSYLNGTKRTLSNNAGLNKRSLGKILGFFD